MIRSAGGTLQFLKAADEAERVHFSAAADILIVGGAPVTRDVLTSLPRLKGIVRTGIGVDTIDLSAARDCGIAVANVPAFCQEEVAEHTVALIFAVVRKAIQADRLVRRGEKQYGN